MPRIFYLFFILLAVGVGVPTARAQSDFRPGYVLPLSGDTLRGEVAQQGTQRSLRQCVFRPGLTAAPTTYQPEQLRGYGLTGIKHYRTGMVPATATSQAPQFMELLVQGNMSLLLSSDDNNDPHFFMLRPGQTVPEELRLIVRTVNENGRVYQQQIRQYQQVLLAAFATHPTLAPTIRRANFNVPDLVDVFEQYNKLVGGTVQVSAAAAARTRFRLGAVLGSSLYGQMALKAAGSSPNYYNCTLTTPLSVMAGLQVAINNPRLSRRLWLQLGAYYERRNYTGRAGRGQLFTSTFDDYYDLRYTATFVQLPVLLHYELGQGRVQPVIEGGIISAFRLSETNNEYTIYYTNNQTPTQRRLLDNARAYEQGLLVGAGVVAALPNQHHVGAVVRYELSNGLSSYSGVSSACSTIRALVSYDLVGK